MYTGLIEFIRDQLTNNIKVCQGRETNIQTNVIYFPLIHDSKIYFSPAMLPVIIYNTFKLINFS